MSNQVNTTASVNLSELVTTSVVAELFNRSQLTISIWRKNKGLPSISIRGDSRNVVRYNMADVQDWAKKTGQRMFPLSAAKDKSQLSTVGV